MNSMPLRQENFRLKSCTVVFWRIAVFTAHHHEDPRLPADAADPHKSCGIKMDGNFTFTGGTAYVYASGKSSNGIRTSGNYTASGGYVEVRATNTNTNCIKIDGNLLLKSGSTTKAFNTGTKAVGITYVGSYTKEDGATLVGSVTQKKD